MGKVLVVVDMQNDFITGSLGTKEAQGIVDNVVKKIQSCKEQGYEILVTLDTHGESYLQSQEGRFLPVEHCIRGTWGWQLESSVEAAVGEARRYEKGTFGSKELAQDLEKMNPESVEFVGLCTDICVVSNVLAAKAWLPETPILVDAGCCAGVTPEAHEAALATMKSCQVQVF